jgi:MoaA/NifB/PqqE/SkfB family radical SAM enzyme
MNQARPALPQLICIEVTNQCSMSCAYCLYDHGQRRNRVISAGILDKLQGVVSNARFVALDGGGEILFNAETIALLHHVAAIAPVAFTTNGKHLTDELIAQLPWERISQLHISFDGFADAIWQTLRRGNKAATVLDAIARSASAIRQRRATTELWVNVVLSTLNVAQVVDVVRTLADMGVRSFHLMHLITVNPDLERYSLFRDKPRCNEMLLAVRQAAAELQVTLVAPPLFAAPPSDGGPAWPYHYPCDQPSSAVFVRSDGTVAACCDPRTVMGSLGEKSFDDIWYGPAYSALRESVNTPNPPHPCRDCIHPVFMNPDLLAVPSCDTATLPAAAAGTTSPDPAARAGRTNPSAAIRGRPASSTGPLDCPAAD